MIKLLTYEGDCVFVHADDTSLKTTKAFTHGSIVFDSTTHSVIFAKLPAVQIPDDLRLEVGAKLMFQLVAPDGTLRKQTRTGVLTANEKQPGILRIGGMAKTPRQFPAEDGWSNAIYKYRAYFTHPGLKTDGEIPTWLQGSIDRQKSYWNRLAWLCRDARRKCSPVPTEAIVAFVNETILPEIDAFNTALGRSKQKMKHPAKLKTQEPGLDGLWHFVGELRTRMEKGRAVPDGLLDKVVAFTQQYKPDYTPLNEFLNNFQVIAEKEAVALNLRRFEIRPTASAFKAVLDRRKTTKASWSDGWPLIKYPDSLKAANWGLHYYFNKAGVSSALLESGSGVPGLSFGPPLKPSATGHAALVGVATKRLMREAEISIPGENKEQWKFRFGVLEHRPLPVNSHLKEWKLLFSDGALWLCLVVELQRPLPAPGNFVAGLQVGWRRTDDGLRFGTLYEPVTSTIRDLNIDLQKLSKDRKDRVPFHIDMSPNRWERRNITLLFLNRKPGEELKFASASDSIRQIASLFPEWKPGDTVPNLLGVKVALQNRRDYLKDTTKILLRKYLEERTPAWLDKAGQHGLLRLQEEMKDDSTVQAILSGWRQNDDQIAKLVHIYSAWTTRRLEYEQTQVAHDVCRYLQAKGIGRLIVETNFLAKLSQQHDNEDPVSLKRSQKYRQFSSVGRFTEILKNTAMKYGIVIDKHQTINITRICQYCDHLNPATEKEIYLCEGCGRQIKQDHNAAVNLSRFACDPELAEMALTAGREA